MGDFNEEIGLDFVHVRDVNGVGHWFLSVVDLWTTYHVVGYAPSHKPEVVAEVFNDLWVSTFGPPKILRIDKDGGFRSTFMEMVERYECFVTACAAQAHWQHGRVERQGGWLKELSRRTIESTSASGVQELKLAMACCCGAKNSLRRRAGFSPNQWVFGVEPRLDGDLCDGENLTIMHNSPTEAVTRRYRIRTAARCAFIEMQTCDVIRRAALSRSRIHKGPWESGSYI